MVLEILYIIYLCTYLHVCTYVSITYFLHICYQFLIVNLWWISKMYLFLFAFWVVDYFTRQKILFIPRYIPYIYVWFRDWSESLTRGLLVLWAHRLYIFNHLTILSVLPNMMIFFIFKNVIYERILHMYVRTYFHRIEIDALNSSRYHLNEFQIISFDCFLYFIWKVAILDTVQYNIQK